MTANIMEFNTLNETLRSRECSYFGYIPEIGGVASATALNIFYNMIGEVITLGNVSIDLNKILPLPLRTNEMTKITNYPEDIPEGGLCGFTPTFEIKPPYIETPIYVRIGVEREITYYLYPQDTPLCEQ